MELLASKVGYSVGFVSRTTFSSVWLFFGDFSSIERGV